MKKKIFTLLTLLLCVCSGAWGQSPITVTWLPNNMSSKTTSGTASTNGILTVSDFTTSTPITHGNNLVYDSKKWGNFTSTTRPTKNKIAPADYITFTVTVKEGYKFTPTSATAYCVGIGTGNNAAGLYTTIQGSEVSSAADNSSNASTTTQKSLELSGSYNSGQSVTFYIHIGQNNTTSSKGVAIRDVVLTGTYTSAASPNISTDKSSASLTATESGVAVNNVISVSGENLTKSGTLSISLNPSVTGLSVSPTSISIDGDGAISATDVTVSYSSTSNVKPGTTTLTLSDGITSKDVTINYYAKVEDWTLQSISESTTWTFDDTNITSGSLNQNISAIYANIDGMTFGNDFDATALELGNATWPYYSNGKIAQAKTFKFNTTVPGTVKVTYNKAGGDAVYISINGDDNGFASSTSTTEAIAVGVGDVIIKGYTDAEHGTEALLNVSKIEFIQTYAVAYATGLAHGSITGKTAAEAGETVTVTVTPDGGYELDDLTIYKASDDSDVTASCSVSNNTFVMPAYAVKVSATFSAFPIVTMPADTRTGYSCTGSTTTPASDRTLHDRTVYEISAGGSITLTVPATTVISKITITGTSAESAGSTVTITGVVGDTSGEQSFNGRKGDIVSFDFTPATQTTTYTITSGASKPSWVIISIYGTENVAKIGETKWGTFSSTSATTFPVDGISAYKVASIGDDKVVVESVTGDVPANTGLLLYGNAGEYTIPIAATDGSSVGDNLMTAGTGANVTSGHVLSGKHGDFRPVPAGGVVVPYGKAYLSTTSGTRSLSIVFDDETTGINSVESENIGLLNGDFYNVAGQRVAKPTKGLYIVNGKKVIIK